MRQSRLISLVEAGTNVAIGLEHFRINLARSPSL